MKKKPDMRGFTVAELLVVIGIMSILFGFAMFEYKGLRNRYNVEKQTKELYISLMSARVSAMQKNRVYFVLLEPVSGSMRYRIIEDSNPSPDGDGVRDALDRVLIDKTLTKPYEFTTSPLVSPNVIEINSRGIANKKQNIYSVNRMGSEYDCIYITETRINMGAWNASSSVCTER